MGSKSFFSGKQYQHKNFWMGFLAGIPTKVIGGNLRNLFYRYILARLGKKVYIQHGVEFSGWHGIEIGDAVDILYGVCVNAEGDRNSRVRIGDRVTLEHGVYIHASHQGSVSIDTDTYIGPYTSIRGSQNVTIGKNCLIAAHSQICAHRPMSGDSEWEISHSPISSSGITIGDDCWLGHSVKVMNGVTIGKSSVIGAGAVVTTDIPAFSVAVGIPARVIKNRSEEFTQQPAGNILCGYTS
ncbi:acyltransferase [Calothrix sp. 336/3]|uniref:acyltransferase n=1 Tax=Calothrix sp. 336/3 TaxID=1337936 RepID=UPI000624DE5F|nr:acyltransferase [Calothrix sp. 336/3]AKG23044.1 hypothetical protein IJ00_18820 [Calothrix sp. 336/3]